LRLRKPTMKSQPPIEARRKIRSSRRAENILPGQRQAGASKPSDPPFSLIAQEYRRKLWLNHGEFQRGNRGGITGRRLSRSPDSPFAIGGTLPCSRLHSIVVAAIKPGQSRGAAHAWTWEDVMNLPRRNFLQFAAGAAIPLPRLALAEDAYPLRPIHVVIGFTPGASADVAGRMLAAGAAPILGQQIVVENKPGAGSSIAAEYVAHSAKDGYTIFLATLSIITNQITNRNESLNLTRDLTTVALLESGAIILVVNPDSHLRSVAELIALAKAKPGEVLHSTVIGSLPHLASELFAQRAGI